MNENRPYLVEYARSGCSKCKVCRKCIVKDSLRIAALVQSCYHDGKDQFWYDMECFFQEHRLRTTGDIDNFDNIHLEDQDFINKKIAENRGTTVSENSSRKRSQAAVATAAAVADSDDFKVEYSIPDGSECDGCGFAIKKGDIRLSKKVAKGLAVLDLWHHVDCFAQLRSDLQFYDEASNISGMSELTEEDQDIVRRALSKIEEDDVPPAAKKIKPESVDAEEEEGLKNQQRKLFSIRDGLKPLKKKVLTRMLQANKQSVRGGLCDILDRLADALLFGALEPCPKCGGQFAFKSGTGYKCTGSVSEWALCENITQDPKRKRFVIPEDLKENHSFLLKPKVQRRLLKITQPSSSRSSFSEEKQDDVTDGLESEPRPLKYLTFVLAGFTEDMDEQLTRDIESMGGTVKPKVNNNITAVITTQDEVKKMSSVVEEAKKRDIHVVSEDFVKEAKELINSGGLALVEEMRITNWGSYPETRVMNSIAMKSVPIDKSDYEKSNHDKQKLRVKGGATVDPDSKLDNVAHVYQRGADIFTVSLDDVSVQKNKNSFYKMQILKHDKKEKYWLFRSWGRIGTKIVRNKCDEKTLIECIDLFQQKFEEKTGNLWSERNFFKKKPNKMYLMIPDADHGDENTFGIHNSNVESTLDEPVQDLMRLIFDIGLMKKAMMEYEIDTAKMPLGKISKKQIQQAHCVLSRLLEFVNSGSRDRVKIIEETNKFYTLIPHNFGIDGPKLIEAEKVIQEKREMLESLLEMNIAYKLVHSQMGTDKNPLDVYYEQLKTDIDVLNRESEMFKLIETYVRNTHAETHNKYKLAVEEVFIAKRNGEESCYESFKNFPNRKLLWHGSRITNFAGILSQGLRIAPPEAPPTGYMFGKGVYFADMVSKSANYCYTDPQNSTGLLLLCEVALGNTYERFRQEQKLPATLPVGCHSTWGRGKTQPDPERSVKLETGVEVPCGPRIHAKLEQKSQLLYNEFIVYDVAQVKVEYIVRMKFEYEDIRNNAALR